MLEKWLVNWLIKQSSEKLMQLFVDWLVRGLRTNQKLHLGDRTRGKGPVSLIRAGLLKKNGYKLKKQMLLK